MEEITETATTTPTRKKFDLKKRFSAKRLALIGVFIALSYAVSLLEFPVFPGSPVSFLQLDFGNVFVLLISFLLGPVEGLLVCVLKECLRMLGGTVVGELANILTTSAYILFPAIVYQYKKGLQWVVPCLVAACFIGTGAALVVNRFITFPIFGELFLKSDGVALFYGSFWLIVAFNLIKTAGISLLTLLLYKRLSNFLKKWRV